MELTISTPALLFSTVSLMMIAFTNRYLAIASLIRELHEKFQKNAEENYVAQIKQLHRRVYIIRNIQFIIVCSLFLSAVSMLCIYLQYQSVAQALFFTALLMQIAALGLSIWEISISIHALKIELSDMEEQLGKRFDLFGRSKDEQ
jgi:ABC-type multidrug transport system permease subunit